MINIPYVNGNHFAGMILRPVILTYPLKCLNLCGRDFQNLKFVIEGNCLRKCVWIQIPSSKTTKKSMI